MNGFGIMGGPTLARHKFHLPLINQDLKTKYLMGFNACAFAEFGHNDYLRWQTEIQYNKKGSHDKVGGDFKNKLGYLCWNNFLKVRIENFFGIPYFLLGARFEYLLSQKIQSPTITSSFYKFHGSPSIGAGWEFTVFSSFKPIVEAHYNPDIKLLAYKSSTLEAFNRPWELRIGLKYVFVNTSNGGSCPAANPSRAPDGYLKKKLKR